MPHPPGRNNPWPRRIRAMAFIRRRLDEGKPFPLPGQLGSGLGLTNEATNHVLRALVVEGFLDLVNDHGAQRGPSPRYEYALSAKGAQACRTCLDSGFDEDAKLCPHCMPDDASI